MNQIKKKFGPKFKKSQLSLLKRIINNYIESDMLNKYKQDIISKYEKRYWKNNNYIRWLSHFLFGNNKVLIDLCFVSNLTEPFILIV